MTTTQVAYMATRTESDGTLLPTATHVWLAMLRAGHPAVFEAILDPRGESDTPFDLIELFAQLRWWHALHPTIDELGETSGVPPPEFPFWADRELQAFHIDVLRNWYLLHKAQVEADWSARSAQGGAFVDVVRGGTGDVAEGRSSVSRSEAADE